MDKLKLLQARKKSISDAERCVRDEIKELIDEDSFVELSAFSFSKNDFYGMDADGEGVVTGFGTIDGYPFYLVGQNRDVLSGGVSLENCKKIEKCLDCAEKNSTPVIYLLSTAGVQVGEGVSVLEGLAGLILRSSQFKGTIPQYLIVDGEVYGQIAVLAATCDFTFFLDNRSVLAVNSPLVLSAADGKNLDKFRVGGADALKDANIASFKIASLSDAKDYILRITGLLNDPMSDVEDLNESLTVLNSSPTADNILKIFDDGSIIELGASYSTEVKCVLGRIGGIAAAAVIFADESGCAIDALMMRKIKDFTEFVACNSLPLINFVNTVGIRESLSANDSLVLREISDYVSVLDCFVSARISVIYGKAIGLGYTLFAAKSMGYDCVYAFATAKVALFDSVAGAEIEFADHNGDRERLAERYADENADPVNAAKGGYIDDIIEPSEVKKYLIASLQMFMR